MVPWTKTEYLRVEMKELRTDEIMEVLMKKLKGILLARKMEKMKLEPMVKMTGLIKMTSCGIDRETVGVTDR